MRNKIIGNVVISAAALLGKSHSDISQENTIKSQALRKFIDPKNPKLPSVQEFVKPHIDAALEGKSIKTQLTRDPETLELARKIINDYGDERNFTELDREAQEQIILGEKENNSNQKASIPVVISRIEGSEYEALYLQHLEKISSGGKKKMVCVGGPSAVDQALMATFIPQIAEKTDVTFIGAGNKFSNLVNSALQVHARHGNALNADSALTGHALLPTLLMRGILRFVDGGESELNDAIDNPSYRKIHVNFTLDSEKLGIYLNNEGNWLKQKFVKEILGKKDQHDLNREESVISARMMHATQKALSEILNREFTIIQGNERENPISSSIHVALTEEEDRETRIENKHLAEIDIESRELSRERIIELFGNNPLLENANAFAYPGDGHIMPEYHTKAQQAVQEFGQDWQEPALLKRVFLSGDENGNPKVAGVVVEENSQLRFIPCDSLHVTAGYMSKIVFDDEKIADKSILAEALMNPTTVATGLSSNLILKRNAVTDKFMEEFKSTGQIAVTNSHWTLLAANQDHVIIRATGGGNTGSEDYEANYFLNVLKNTGRIYGEDALVGVIRTYGCPRSVNAINATCFEKMAQGFVVSYGKGGTGNTKRFSEAAIAADILGYGQELIAYFSQEHLQDQSGKNLGEQISGMIKEFKNERGFFQDTSGSTASSMGYKEGTLFDYENKIKGNISSVLTLEEIGFAILPSSGIKPTTARKVKAAVNQLG